MKKQLLSICIILTIALQGFSQGRMILPSALYEDMKANGKLKPDVQYIIAPDVHPTLPLNNNAKDANSQPNNSQRSVHYSGHNQRTPAPSCSCIIPNVAADTSFHIAPIVQGTPNPPEYRNDDGSTAQMTLPFNFCFYGVNYNHFYINNNGNITFDVPVSVFSAVGFPSGTYDMVAPFWGDVMTTNPASGLVYYQITPTHLVVQWDTVGYFSNLADLRNTFQLIITDGTDPILPPGNNIAFCYGDMQWTTGGASCTGAGSCSYNNNTYACTPFCGVPATVGANNGTNGSYFQMGRFDHPGVDYTGAYNNDGVSWLDYQSLYFNTCATTNIAPIASGLNNCDTIHVCSIGDTLILNALFLSPETGQNTTISVNLNGTPGASVISNTSGNSANAIVRIIASAANAGNNVITFTATDNGTPVGTTIVNANVFVDNNAPANFNPQITGNLNFCSGGSTTLNVVPTTYDSYVWNTGALSTSISVIAPGTYWVTSGLNGCFKTSSVTVTEHPAPTPLIAGTLNTCTGGNVTLYSDSLIYSSYSWSGNATGTNDSIVVGNGTYFLTVTNAFGCSATSPPVTVTGPTPPVITGTPVCNGSLATLSTTTPYVHYHWSNGDTTSTTHEPTGSGYTVTVHDINGCILTSAPYTVAPFNYALSVTGVQPYCAGQSIILHATTSNSASNPTYTWVPGGSGPNISVNSPGVVTVTLHYSNGCTADSTFTVPPPNPLPIPTITGLNFTCNGGNTTLTANPSTYSHYLWNGVTPTDTTQTASVPAGVYTVTVTDVNGCVGTSAPDTVNNISPSVTVTGNQQFCLGDHITLTANPIPTSGISSYLWSNNQTTPTIQVSAAGTYHVTVHYANGCTALSPNTIVTLFPQPIASDTINPRNTSSPVTPIQFGSTSTIASPGSITSYFWDFGDGSTSNLPFTTHSYNYVGTYTVTLKVCSNDGCCDSVKSDYIINDIISVPNVFTPNVPGKDNVNQYLYFKNLEYYPNPTLIVYNRWGTKVYENSNYQNDWNGGKEVDGIYYFVLNAPLFKEPIYGFVQIIR